MIAQKGSMAPSHLPPAFELALPVGEGNPESDLPPPRQQFEVAMAEGVRGERQRGPVLEAVRLDEGAVWSFCTGSCCPHIMIENGVRKNGSTAPWSGCTIPRSSHRDAIARRLPIRPTKHAHCCSAAWRHMFWIRISTRVMMLRSRRAVRAKFTHCPPEPETAVVGCQAPCAPIQKRHTKSIYCGERYGRLTAPRAVPDRPQCDRLGLPCPHRPHPKQLVLHVDQRQMQADPRLPCLTHLPLQHSGHSFPQLSAPLDGCAVQLHPCLPRAAHPRVQNPSGSPVQPPLHISGRSAPLAPRCPRRGDASVQQPRGGLQPGGPGLARPEAPRAER
jgi:hypothetical protein